MKKILILLLSCVILLNTNILVKGAKKAQTKASITSVKTTNIKSKNYRFQKEWTSQGVINNHAFFFNIDENWDIQSSYLNLIFTQSNLIDINTSTITILLNNSPIYSSKLANKNNYKENLKINIPKDKIIKGYNEIKIKTYRRISEKPCIDDVNSGNWITFHKESYVHINFKDRKDSNSLKEFPFPYIKNSDEIPVNAMILLPDNFNNGQITAAMMLCTNFGSKRKFDNINTKIYKLSEATPKKDNNLIFIGNPKNTPKEILNLLSIDENKILNENALIKEVVSPYNKNKKLLIIISNKEDKLIKGATLLSSKEFISQINGDKIIVDDTLDVKDIKLKDKNKIYFKDLGYGNVTLKGAFTQEASYTMSIPKNRIIQKDAKILIKSRYSKNLDFDRSLITIYINDIPIGSKKLNSKTANNDIFEISIPEDVRDNNSYEIKITFNLDLKDVFCTFREEENPWAYISNDSYIYAPFKEGKNALFENYPNPFIANGKFNNFTLIVPDKCSSQEITWLGNIMACIGHDIESNRGKFNVVKENNVSNENLQNNLIIIGTPKNNSFIKNLNKNMHIKFNKDFTAYSSNEKIKFIKDYSKEISTLQFIDSPYNSRSKIMIMSSVNNENLYLGTKYLQDLALYKKLKGNAVVIDNDGLIKHAYFGDKYDKNKNNFFKSKNINITSQTKYFIIFLFSIMSMIFILFIFLIKKHK